MLSELYVENVAVIEKINLNLRRGFSVITGETGAGKSILIDSINLLLGERASRELLRTGCEKAAVSALFTEISKVAAQRLDALNCGPDEDGSLLVYREIASDGKGICRINGKPISVAILKEVGKLLVNIHGQHDNQSLLDEAKHISILDEYAKNSAEKAAYEEAYVRVQELRQKLRSLQTSESEKLRLAEMYRFQLSEIGAAELKPDEDEELNRRKEMIRNSGKIADGLSQAYASLYEAEGVSAKLQIDEAIHSLTAISDYSPTLGGCRDRLTEISYSLTDIIESIRDLRDGMDYDASDIDLIERRLDIIYRLKKKYGTTVKDILEYAEEIAEKLDGFENREAEIAKLETTLKSEISAMHEKAGRLTETRKAAGDRLQTLIEKELAYLDMPKARFLVQLQCCECNPDGMDAVSFLLSPNLGEVPKPLSKIASGGELSRIMLAIKSILGDADIVDTLIFDEIDTGVSGKAAQKIGYKMKRIAQNRQTICVTHLAQIAALADNHLKISKSNVNNKTFTTVRELSYKEKIDELAVIIGGESVTETTKMAAKELLDKSYDTGETTV